MLDDNRVTTKTELLKSQEFEQTKEHIVFDSAGRPKLIFSATIDVRNMEPCLCVEYVYRSAGSTDIRTRQERVSRWNTVWEDDFIFDPTVDYDPDGNGEL